MNSAIKRIGVLVSSMRMGGAEKNMISLANGFAELTDYECHIITPHVDGPLKNDVISLVHIHALAGKRFLKSVPEISRIIDSASLDVVISTQPHVNLATLFAAVLSKSHPVVVLREANTPSEELRRHFKQRGYRYLIYHLLARICYRYAKAIVAVSQGVKDDLHLLKFHNPSKIHLIYNPVLDGSICKLASEVPIHPWLCGTIPVAVAVGRIAPQKDYVTLLRAVELFRRNRQLRLIIVGDIGDNVYADQLRELISKLGIQDCVDFTGFKPNPFPYMKHANVYVMSSVYEGLPGALIQALALSRSIVSTDCRNGPAEILDRGKYGYLVPIEDPNAMARAILDAIDKPGPPPEARALERFAYNENIRRYRELVESLLGE